jgi:hypothetical protein
MLSKHTNLIIDISKLNDSEIWMKITEENETPK